MNDYIEINGLQWDKENLIVAGIEHFNHAQAEIAAKASGKRLPTKEEWEALASLGSTWDENLKGRWFGEDHQLKERSEKSIFLPASGYRDCGNAMLYTQGSYGYYWSGSISSTNACYLGFNSGSVYPDNITNSGYGFVVRCVKN